MRPLVKKPKEKETKQLTLRIPKKLLRALEIEAQGVNISVQQAIIQVLDHRYGK